MKPGLLGNSGESQVRGRPEGKFLSIGGGAALLKQEVPFAQSMWNSGSSSI